MGSGKLMFADAQTYKWRENRQQSHKFLRQSTLFTSAKVCLFCAFQLVLLPYRLTMEKIGFLSCIDHEMNTSMSVDVTHS